MIVLDVWKHFPWIQIAVVVLHAICFIASFTPGAKIFEQNAKVQKIQQNEYIRI